MTADRMTDLLRGSHFPQRVEHARRRSGQYYAPWPPGAPEQPSGPLPREWELTAFRGLVAARDRAAQDGTGAVYIGEDSLRFVDTILDARPTGRAVDVGCGSGITSSALARTCDEVIALDVQQVCLEATALSGTLNGSADRIHPWHGDVFAGLGTGGPADLGTSGPFGCVAANLPYAPVPPGLAYSAAGNGGPDGLDLNRLLLRSAPGLLDPHTGMLVTRFHSLGDASGPILLHEIREFAARTGHDVAVVADGRTSSLVRAALTAVHAARHNPDLAAAEVLRLVDAHQEKLGMPYVYACSLVSRAGGSGTVTFTDLSSPVSSDTPVLAVPGASPESVRAAGRLYQNRTTDLPDGFWELGGTADVEGPPERLPQLLGALDGVPSGPRTALTLAELVFADRFEADAIRARALYVTTEVMLGCLAEAGVVRSGTGE
ncbi:hypothetical protein ACH4JZ_02210 [Streptomyces sp. NPDC017615]|uniref:hypothetical protein n=1 Tax=Streptomyces sp. NPDC017615 TaxID=3365003 RepID=UPI0037AB12E0